MDIPRTALGNPFIGFQKAPQVRPDQTAGVLSKVAAIGSGVSKEYRKTQRLNEERKAKRDILNNNINPELEKSSVIYAGKVAEYNQLQKFNQYKDAINSGQYNETDPLEFQKQLDNDYNQFSDDVQEDSFSDLLQEVHSNFWLKNESALVAAQRGQYTKQQTVNQEELFTKTVGEQFKGDYDPKQIKAAVSHVLNNAGNLVSTDYKKKALMNTAVIQAMDGKDGLLNAMEDKFNVSADPGLSALYRSGLRLTHNAQKEQDRVAELETQKRLIEAENQGTVTFDNIKSVLENPKMNFSRQELMGYFVRSQKNAKINERVDLIATRLQKGQPFSTVGVPQDRLEKMYNTVFQNLVSMEKDPEIVGRLYAGAFGNTDDIPDIIKKESNTLTDIQLYTKDNEVNPRIKDTYRLFKGIKNSKNYSNSQFKRLFSGNADAMRTFNLIDSYVGGTEGNIDSRIKAAVHKLEQIREGDKVHPSLVNEKVKEAIESFDDYVTEHDDDWFFWDSTKSDLMRSHFKTRYINFVENELRAGFSLEVARENAMSLCNKSFTFEFNQVQDTDGVPIAHRAGFKNTDELEKAFKYVVEKDEQISGSVKEVFGDANVNDQIIYYDKISNSIRIEDPGSDKIVRMNVQTLHAKWAEHLDELDKKEIDRRKESAEKIFEKQEARRADANTKVGQLLLSAEKGSIGTSPWKDERVASASKLKKVLSDLPAPYTNITFDKYNSMGIEQKSKVRKALYSALADTQYIKGVSSDYFQRFFGEKEEIVPYKSLLGAAADWFKGLFTTDEYKGELPNLEEPLSSAMKQVENNKSGSDYRDGMFYPHGSAEGGTDTIGYGHKLTKQEQESGKYSNGITEKEAEKLYKSDMAKARSRAKSSWDGYNNLPEKYKKVIDALTFNIGKVTKEGWPNLYKAMQSGDDQKVREEMLTKYKKNGKWVSLEKRRDIIADALGLS